MAIRSSPLSKENDQDFPTIRSIKKNTLEIHHLRAGAPRYHVPLPNSGSCHHLQLDPGCTTNKHPIPSNKSQGTANEEGVIDAPWGPQPGELRGPQLSPIQNQSKLPWFDSWQDACQSDLECLSKHPFPQSSVKGDPEVHAFCRRFLHSKSFFGLSASQGLGFFGAQKCGKYGPNKLPMRHLISHCTFAQHPAMLAASSSVGWAPCVVRASNPSWEISGCCPIDNLSRFA